MKTILMLVVSAIVFGCLIGWTSAVLAEAICHDTVVQEELLSRTKWTNVMADSSGEAIAIAQSRNKGWTAVDVKQPPKGSRNWRVKLRRD